MRPRPSASVTLRRRRLGPARPRIREAAHRAVIGLLVVGALVTGGTVLSAAPAGAAPPAISFGISGSLLTVTGDGEENSVTAGRTPAGVITLNGTAIDATTATILDIVVDGAGGNDTLRLDEANGAMPRIEFRGGEGNDQLSGGSKANSLHGGPGADAIIGNGGDDVLIGSPGNDTLLGGAGTDRFELRGGTDVTDATPGEVVIP